MGLAPPTRFRQGLLGCLLDLLAPVLRPGREAGPFEWSLDESGTRFEARRGGAPEVLARLSFVPAWPPPVRSFGPAGTLVSGFDPAPGLSGRDLAALSEQALGICKRLHALDRKLPRLVSLLLPRGPSGEIDWDASPFAAPPRLPPTSRAYIKLGEVPCGLRCSFCTRSALPDRPPPPDIFRADLVFRTAAGLAMAAGGDAEALIGGDEPMNHPDLRSLVALASRRGFSRIRLLTGAVSRLDAPALARLTSAGLTMVELPLYGTTAATHDGVVGVEGHFEGLTAAAAAVRAAGLALEMHSVALVANLRELQDLPAFAARLGASAFRVHYPRMEGDSRVPYRDNAPRLTDIPLGARALLDLRIPCVGAGTAWPASAGPGPQAEVACRAQEGAIRSTSVVFPPACRDCAARSECSGLYSDYLDLHGDGEVSPIRAR